MGSEGGNEIQFKRVEADGTRSVWLLGSNFQWKIRLTFYSLRWAKGQPPTALASHLLAAHYWKTMGNFGICMELVGGGKLSRKWEGWWIRANWGNEEKPKEPVWVNGCWQHLSSSMNAISFQQNFYCQLIPMGEEHVFLTSLISGLPCSETHSPPQNKPIKGWVRGLGFN